MRARAKNTGLSDVRLYLPSDPRFLATEARSSVRGQGKVALGTLYLLMIGDVGLGLVDDNDRFLLSLKKPFQDPRTRTRDALTSLHWPRNPT